MVFKLFTKEDIIPQMQIGLIFMVAPVITAATAFIALRAVPGIPRIYNTLYCGNVPSKHRFKFGIPLGLGHR